MRCHTLPVVGQTDPLRENLNAFKVSLEHTRAQANGELVHTLQDYEEEESLRFDRMEREWEDQLKDPDDVFFAAQNRKREIKEQIKELQRGLKRQTVKPRVYEHS